MPGIGPLTLASKCPVPPASSKARPAYRFLVTSTQPWYTFSNCGGADFASKRKGWVGSLYFNSQAHRHGHSGSLHALLRTLRSTPGGLSSVTRAARALASLSAWLRWWVRGLGVNDCNCKCVCVQHAHAGRMLARAAIVFQVQPADIGGRRRTDTRRNRATLTCTRT